MKPAKNVKLYNSITNIKDEIVEEAQTTKLKKENSAWLKWGVLAACLCLVVIFAITIPSMLEPVEPVQNEGGGVPIASNPSHSSSEIIPTLLAQQEVIEEIKRDMEDQDIPGWTETPNATLNFSHIIPIYATANMTESSSSILETLTFDNQYMIPALSKGECIGAFTVSQHEEKWTIASYYIGLNIESELKKNEKTATCFISVLQLNEFGFLSVTDIGEKYMPLPGFGNSKIMSGNQLLEKIRNTQSSSSNTDG